MPHHPVLAADTTVVLDAEIIGKPFQWQETQLRSTVANITLDTTKARLTLGWAPEVDLKNGFTELFAPVLEGAQSCAGNVNYGE